MLVQRHIIKGCCCWLLLLRLKTRASLLLTDVSLFIYVLLSSWRWLEPVGGDVVWRVAWGPWQVLLSSCQTLHESAVNRKKWHQDKRDFLVECSVVCSVQELRSSQVSVGIYTLTEVSNTCLLWTCRGPSLTSPVQSHTRNTFGMQVIFSYKQLLMKRLRRRK